MISIQPSTCEVSASATSQPALGQVGTRSSAPRMSARITAVIEAKTDVSNSSPAGWERSISPWRWIRMKVA